MSDVELMADMKTFRLAAAAICAASALAAPGLSAEQILQRDDQRKRRAARETAVSADCRAAEAARSITETERKKPTPSCTRSALARQNAAL